MTTEVNRCEAVPLLDLQSENTTQLAKDIIAACKQYGFMQFKNHGVDPDLVKEMMETWRKFYDLPSDVKNKYRKGETTDPWGYISSGMEWFNTNRGADLKECFNIILDNPRKLPEEIPNIEEISKQLSSAMYKVTIRILKFIAKGLHLEEDYFSKTHSPYPAVYPENMSGLRSLYYPALQDLDPGDNADSIRCGEHTDYGSISIIFQDMAGGLQLLDKDGQYKDIVPIENAIAVNIADLMQRWTGDRLISTKHRVVLPANSNTVSRMSLAYFATPDGSVIIETTPSSDEKITHYAPISALDYMNMKFEGSYYSM